VQQLLVAGADVHVGDEYGSTPSTKQCASMTILGKQQPAWCQLCSSC
jgi:hypothetical protein